ncbi:MAG TPA: hypothetical protein VGM63_25145 [Mucilaginibacter sp.]|jgi:hypothetical protein
MKKLILCVFLLPSAGRSGFNNANSSSENLVEVRSGAWPINLERNTERSGTSYSLIFRDQQVMNAQVSDTLEFANLEQLKYLEKALTTLKTGHNGDIAKFKDFTLKRADRKFEGIWYILQPKYGTTDFQQPEADILTKTIRGL